MTAVRIKATEATIRDIENKKKGIVEHLSEIDKKLASLQGLIDLRATKQRELDGLKKKIANKERTRDKALEFREALKEDDSD